MKVSKLSPFIVIPSPEGVKEKRPARKVKAKENSSALVEEDPFTHEDPLPAKVVPIAKATKAKKRQSEQNASSKLKAIASYNRIMAADELELLKDNFKKKI